MERRKRDIKKIDVIFVIVDNKPHLTERGVTNLLKFVSQLYIVTTNPKHPANRVKDSNLSVVNYESSIDFKDLFVKLKSLGADKVTIQSGGDMNAELMRSGLINFVSLVVAPVMIGGRNTAALLGGKSLESSEDLALLKPLELISIDRLNDSYLHLRYKVLHYFCTLCKNAKPLQRVFETKRTKNNHCIGFNYFPKLRPASLFSICQIALVSQPPVFVHKSQLSPHTVQRYLLTNQ